MDTFSDHKVGLSSPAVEHVELTADPNTDLSPRPRAIHCQASGTITVTDANGVALPYTLQTGMLLAVRAVRVTAISGGTFYGWT